MIRSPRGHEGTSQEARANNISTTGLAFGAAAEGRAIRHNTSPRKPRVDVNSQRSVLLKKTP